MAIVISGVNNNDRITAADGTIDLLSSANLSGILTAPAFSASGNVTAGHLNIGSGIQLGNAGVATATTFVGNLTGNVNSSSVNLLFQIGGSEKLRLNTNGEIGILGANYGTSGQVLTSQGAGSAVTWSTIPTPDADKITEGNTEAEVIDTGSDGHFKVTTEGSERFRIDSSGHIHTGYISGFGNDHINILASDGGGVSIASNNAGNATTGDILGSLSFQGYLNTQTYSNAEARISAVVTANHTGSSAATDMVFFTKPSTTGPGSAPTERVQIKSGGGLVSNKGGGNIAFSDGYSAIEARAPEGTTQLTVTNSTYESGTYDNEAGIWFKGNYSGNNERAKSAIIHKNIGDYGVGGLHFCVDNGYDNQNASYADRKMSITKDGYVTMPNRPCFDVVKSNGNVSSGNYIIYNTDHINNGGHYSTSTGKFTAPVAGFYFFAFGTIKNTSSVTRLYIRKNQSNVYNAGRHLRIDDNQGGYGDNGAMTIVLSLAVGDEIQIYCGGGEIYGTTQEYCYFNGFLLG